MRGALAGRCTLNLFLDMLGELIVASFVSYRMYLGRSTAHAQDALKFRRLGGFR